MQHDLSMADKQELMKMNQQLHIPTQMHQQQMRHQQDLMANGQRGMAFNMESHTTGKKMLHPRYDRHQPGHGYE